MKKMMAALSGINNDNVREVLMEYIPTYHPSMEEYKETTLSSLFLFKILFRQLFRCVRFGVDDDFGVPL